MSEEESQSTSSVDELLHQQDFGSRFREAREGKNLSLGDISDELKLPEETLRALELSSIEQLPAPAFTQGYIRSYARFLNLPEDEILEIYNQLLPEKEIPLSARSSLPRQAHSGETKIKLTTYGFLLTGLFVMVLWWFQSVPVPEPVDTKVEAIEEEISITKAEVVENKIVEIHVDESNEEVKPKADEHKTLSVKAVESTSANVSKYETAVKKPVLTVPVEVNEDDLISQSKKTTTGDVSEFVAASGDDVLILGTISESWVEIQDATTPRLVFELIKKGGYYRVKGQAPFKVFLGNAPSVSIQLNGNEVNVLGYLRSDKLVHVYIYKNGEVVSVSRHEKSQNKIKEQSSVSEDDQISDTILPELE